MNYSIWSVGSDCFHTSRELANSSLAIGPRPPRSGGLVIIVLVRIQAWLLCLHTPKQTLTKGETAPGFETNSQVWCTLICIFRTCLHFIIIFIEHLLV